MRESMVLSASAKHTFEKQEIIIKIKYDHY